MSLKPHIEFNCDLGEYDDLSAGDQDAAIMPLIQRCNIASGGHAGNAAVIKHTMQLAHEHGVHIGAHPSFPDRVGFGRTAMPIGLEALRGALVQQLDLFFHQAQALGLTVSHIKPHGALYNEAMVQSDLAHLLVDLAKKFGPEMMLVGLPNSKLAECCESEGVGFLAEGFLDRHYQASGLLKPRDQVDAMLTDPRVACQRLMSWQRSGQIDAWDGSRLPMPVSTWCVHGDTPGALAFLLAVQTDLESRTAE